MGHNSRNEPKKSVQMGFWGGCVILGAVAKEESQGNVAGALISKRNCGKVNFEAHRLLLRILDSISWRTPRELLTKCPGSTRALILWWKNKTPEKEAHLASQKLCRH